MAKTEKKDLEAQVTPSEETAQEEILEQELAEMAEEVQETESAETQEGENEENSNVDEQASEDEEPEKEEAQVRKEEYVEYCLPFLPGVDVGESQTVTLNGKNYQVQYGVPVKVPVGVKEILEEMVKQTRLIKDKVDRLSKEEKCIAKFD